MSIREGIIKAMKEAGKPISPYHLILIYTPSYLVPARLK